MPRRKNDTYYTPELATRSLLGIVSINSYNSVLEPCSGTGGISNVLTDRFTRVSTNDIDDSVDAGIHVDYLSVPVGWFPKYDWVITNPPFSLAIDFLKKAREETRVGVAMLLRLSFLEPTRDRGYYLSNNQPNHVIVLPRISFTGDSKTDSVTTAWMVWIHGESKQRITIVSKGVKQ